MFAGQLLFQIGHPPFQGIHRLHRPGGILLDDIELLLGRVIRGQGSHPFFQGQGHYFLAVDNHGYWHKKLRIISGRFV